MKKTLKKYRWAILIGILLSFGVGRIIYLCQKGYVWADWSVYRDKSFWMILELAVMPFSLAIFAYLLDKFDVNKSRETAKDNQEENILQNYFEFIARRIENIDEMFFTDRLKNILSAKTKSIIRRLNGTRKGMVLEFLYDAGLILNYSNNHQKYPIIDLNNSNFKESILNFSILDNAYLSSINLSKAIIYHVSFENVNTYEATFVNTKFDTCFFTNSNFPTTSFQDSTFMNCYFKNVDFSYSSLNGVKIINSTITNIIFPKALISMENLDFTNSFMPDGKKYDPEIHTIDYLTGKKQEEK